MKSARPGDIVLFRLDHSDWRSWLRPWAKIIAWLQGNPVTHTAVVVDPEWGVVIESYWPRVRVALFDDVLQECYEWDVVSPVDVTVDQRRAVVAAAKSAVGSKYDTRSLWGLARWLLVEKLLGLVVRKTAYIQQRDEEFFCQELVTWCYEKAGYGLAKRLGFDSPSLVLPKDIDLRRDLFLVIESSYGWPTFE